MCSFATAQHAIAQAFTKKQCLQEFSGHLSFSFSTASMGTEAQNRGPQVPIEIQKVLSIHCIQAQAICLSRPCSCLLSYLMLSLPSLPPSLPPALPPSLLPPFLPLLSSCLSLPYTPIIQMFDPSHLPRLPFSLSEGSHGYQRHC